MKTQNRCEKSKFLPELVEGRSSENERVRLEAHLESCEACQQDLDRMVDGDETTGKVRSYLRHSRPVTDKVLLDVMDRIRTTTSGLEGEEPFRLEDFAVDYLHPSDTPDSLGRIGPYEISEVLGGGGMGIVLKGYDSSLKRVVAVKVMAPALALNATARKRFLREAQAAAAVAHPNVVMIHSVDEDRLPYLVMEFVDGPSLQEKLESEGFLQLNQILRIGVQVASGLAAAHAQGLIHRDIKPANILLENGMERVKLTDFGVARAADDASVTREGTVVGTPQYMSPEQARGETVDQTSDLFSLGSVLYTLAAGRLPFRAESTYGVMRRITDETPTPIRELNPEIPEWLCAIIDRLMAKDKDERFESVAELHELLEACLNHAQQPTATKLPDIPELSAKSRISQVLRIFAGVCVMVTIATCLILVFGIPSMLEPGLGTDQRAGAEQDRPRFQREPSLQDQGAESKPYEKEFVVAFPNPDEIGTLNVDIKRGSIQVTGYDGDEVIVELSVPNYSQPENRSADGLKELRSNTLGFEIEKSNKEIKLDGNSYEYITNLTIKVPRSTNLILDTYRNGLIHVRNVEGSFNVRSHNCNIHLEDVSGDGRLWSYNGSLTASFKTVTEDHPLYFESYNGSIDLTLPANTKADARYRSGSGSVLTDFDIAISDDVIRDLGDGSIEFDEFIYGTLNGGGATLTLETEKGDIRLRQRQDARRQ